MGLSSDRCELEVTIALVNHAVLSERGSTWQGTHSCMLLIGDANNTALCKQKLRFGHSVKACLVLEVLSFPVILSCSAVENTLEHWQCAGPEEAMS